MVLPFTESGASSIGDHEEEAITSFSSHEAG